MAFLEYTTSSGDRWDQIAFKYYGDATKMNTIRDANQDIPSYDKLPAGLKIKIPILEDDTGIVDITKLPIWKQ